MVAQHSINQLTDHLFRHEAGKMVAVLTRIFGAAYLETAEDVVQETLLHAMQVWKLKGIPENPSAWLFRVAKNKAIDTIRKNKHTFSYDFDDSERVLLSSEYTLGATLNQIWDEYPVKDDLLRMMFVCCHPGISEENQITLILKTLCGFSTAEIAKAFLAPEDTVSKRLYRSKEFFRKHKVRFEIPSGSELKKRTDAVLRSVYLLFNEGYQATHTPEVIRKDLMEEAIILGRLLLENEHTKKPEAYALMALFCLHTSRNEGRLTADGGIILLPNQNRSLWNQNLIAEGNYYLNKAATGDELTAYHIEAAIAYEHCAASQFNETNWPRILQLYEWLIQIAPSPIIELNMAVVVMQTSGPEQALQLLLSITNLEKMGNFYLYHSLLGEVYAKLGQYSIATNHLTRALSLTQSPAEQQILKEKLQALPY